MSRSPLVVLAFVVVAAAVAVYPPAEPPAVLHLPITRSHSRSLTRRAPGSRVVAGLGDFFDVTYSVLVQVGPALTPLVLDTGSSDLWAISDACVNCTDGDSPLFPAAALHPTSQLGVTLKYGDSSTRTLASGPIGTTTVGVAGLSLQNQYIAAISDTNTTISVTGATGIFGLGFPIASVVFADMFKQTFVTCTDCRAAVAEASAAVRRFHPERSHVARAPGFPTHADLLSLLPLAAPFVPRAVDSRMLREPMISITLQRETIDPGGNAGMISLGGLPDSVQRDKVVWMDVRRYSVDDIGLPDTVDDGGMYPLAWELALDDVFLDGHRLPRTNLTSPAISISALIDTGNSLIRGPSDVITSIIHTITSSSDSRPLYDCTPHVLAFSIGGRLFPVDPRDLIAQATPDAVGVSDPRTAQAACSLNLAVTDTPVQGNGFLFTWSLGVPFLKSVLAAFRYGNITHPETDWPQIGLLSTVPHDASDHLAQVVTAAGLSDGNLPALSQAAPTATFDPSGTGIAGVPLAAPSVGSTLTQPPKHSTGGASARHPSSFSTICAFVTCIVLTALR